MIYTFTTISIWWVNRTLSTGFNCRTVIWSTGSWLAHVIGFTVTHVCFTRAVFGTNSWCNSSVRCTTVIGITSTPLNSDIAIFSPSSSRSLDPRSRDPPAGDRAGREGQHRDGRIPADPGPSRAQGRQGRRDGGVCQGEVETMWEFFVLDWFDSECDYINYSLMNVY